MSIPTKRPEDFFAQMAKSDDHMKRVNRNLNTGTLYMWYGVYYMSDNNLQTKIPYIILFLDNFDGFLL